MLTTTHLLPRRCARLPQIQPHDAFGQQMLLNLESRGCPLLGIEGEGGSRAERSAAQRSAAQRSSGWLRACK